MIAATRILRFLARCGLATWLGIAGTAQAAPQVRIGQQILVGESEANGVAVYRGSPMPAPRSARSAGKHRCRPGRSAAR
jgi:hypothetical protein